MSGILRSSLLSLFCLPALGCGYHTAGKVNTIPENVHTIAVPAFVNQTQTYKIEQMLTGCRRPRNGHPHSLPHPQPDRLAMPTPL